MNMLDYTADQRIFSFERASPFWGLLGGMFKAMIGIGIADNFEKDSGN
jgi:hypothetical protein